MNDAKARKIQLFAAQSELSIAKQWVQSRDSCNKFTSDEVGNCFSDLFTPHRLCSKISSKFATFLQVKCQIVMHICPIVKVPVYKSQ